MGEVMQKLGAVPQSLPGGEVYQALEKGTIDAAEWVGPYDDQKLGFNKVAPYYYYYPGWWECGPEVDFFVGQKAWDTLSPENKAIIDAASALASSDMLAKYDALNPIALKQLVAAKTKVLPFPQSVLEASFNASMDVFALNESKSPEWKKSRLTCATFNVTRYCGFDTPNHVLIHLCKPVSCSSRCILATYQKPCRTGLFCF